MTMNKFKLMNEQNKHNYHPNELAINLLNNENDQNCDIDSTTK